MSTFLELCQQVMARDTGTATSGNPTTVVGQTGRKGQIVSWVASAYNDIQSAERDWMWLQAYFSGSTVASQREYTGAQMGVASRFGRFICRMNGREDRYSIYKTATGVSDEGKLHFLPYDVFRVNAMRGTQTEGRPKFFTIAPAGTLLLHPIPDAVYTVQGPYRKSNQVLAADSDEPEMPEEYHDLIGEVALSMYAGLYDEAPQIQGWSLRRSVRFNQLRRDQLPPMSGPEPFC